MSHGEKVWPCLAWESVEAAQGQRSGPFGGIRAVFRCGALRVLFFSQPCGIGQELPLRQGALCLLSTLRLPVAEWGLVPKERDSHFNLSHMVVCDQEQVLQP